MARERRVRIVRRGMVALVSLITLLASCQVGGRGGWRNAADGRGHDLQAEDDVPTLAAGQLDLDAVRIYWSGESSFAVDGQWQVAGRRALMRHVAGQEVSRLDHGIVLVAPASDSRHNPADSLRRFCVRNNVDLYHVVVASPEPDEPAVPDGAADLDWRADLPDDVRWIVRATRTMQDPEPADLQPVEVAAASR